MDQDKEGKTLSFTLLDQQWKKNVTLDPPNAVKFKETHEDSKSTSQIVIKNHSSDYILFKVIMID